MPKERLILIDGHALVHRAYHALPPLTVRKTGEMVNAVYGFASMLLKAISELKPTHFAIAFDRPAPTFRHELFSEYKAQRPETPEDLQSQMGRVKELVQAFRIPVYELDGYEADDVLGTLSRQAQEKGIETIIVTGDADTMQLVSPKVKVLYPKPRGSFSDTMLYDEKAVSQKYGVKPQQIADLKALVGDASDNIPGVPGIGKVTAVKLLNQFGSIEGIYEHIDEVTPEKVRSLLKKYESQARRSKELAKIVTETEVSLNLDDCRLSHYDRARVTELFRELEFFSLLPKLSALDELASEVKVKLVGAQGAYKLINTTPAFEELLNHLAQSEAFSFDLETTSLDAMSAQIVGISLSPAPGEAFYLPLGHVSLKHIEQLPQQQVLSGLKPLFEDERIKKYAHNAKYDLVVLAEHGLRVGGLAFDTMLAAYLLGEKSLNLKNLAFTKLGIEMTSISDLIGSGSKQLSFSQVEVEKAAPYAAADADITFRLKGLLEKEIERQGLKRLFFEVEMPLLLVLVKMERNGMALDKELLWKMSQRLGEELVRLEKAIYASVGHQFNINSPSQLSSVLFGELHLEPSKKTKSGYSTGAAILEELRGAHPVIDLIIEYRQLSKLKSTYVDTLPGLVNEKTGRLHTSFNQTRTATGRLSSSDPNLQNIPARGELAKEIRRAFIAPEGTRLLAGDYSQIDLRVLAHLSQDKNLLAAFKEDKDIHAATAAQVFGVPPSQVTPEMRRAAKTINFGVIYGMSEYGLEQATEFSREEAAQFIAAYFEKYPGVKRYLEETKEKARKLGYVETILGRRRYLPEINSKNRQVREAAVRMAINMPVQGTSADIIKLAMIELDRKMEELSLESKMLLQVHDELIFEVPQDEQDEMQKLVPQLMSKAMELSVPLKVDLKMGQNWGEME